MCHPADQSDPRYNVFLPEYLTSRGAKVGVTSAYAQWRNYAVANVCSIPSPILAGFMCKSRWFWGRRGTMIIGALITMAFFFAYTQVRTEAQNFGFTCAISFCLVSHSFRLTLPIMYLRQNLGTCCMQATSHSSKAKEGAEKASTNSSSSTKTIWKIRLDSNLELSQQRICTVIQLQLPCLGGGPTATSFHFLETASNNSGSFGAHVRVASLQPRSFRLR